MKGVERSGGRPYGRVITAVTVCALVLAVAGCGGSSAKHASTAATTPTSLDGGGLRGLIPSPLPVKPNFTLPDTAGTPYNFDAETSGKLTYLFFGYTHCPDACPATMSYLKYALQMQSPAFRKNVTVVFVTVDPRRDTGPVLRRWLNHYSRSFVGITGTLKQIGIVEHEAGVPTAIRVSGSADYQVEHSSILFVYSPDDRAHVVYAQGFKPADYAHDMPILMKFGAR